MPVVMDQPTEEWFDVVDGNDQVIGRGLRADVHAKRLFHRSVHIFIFDEQGRILIQRRSMTKDTNPGKWTTSCSGHVDSGEDYALAMRRELSEEVGVELAPNQDPQFLFQISPCRATGNEFSNVYRLEWNGNVRPEAGDVDELQWLPVAALKEWIDERPQDFATSFLFLLTKFGL